MRIGRGVGLAAGLGAATLAGALAEAKAYRVVEHAVRLSEPVPAFRLRVLHLSDLHYMAGQTDKLAFLRGLAALEPDLVIGTGDLLCDDAGLDELTAALGGLLAKPGAFVFGSNDYMAPAGGNPLRYLKRRTSRHLDLGLANLDWQRFRDVLKGAGWADLSNARARLRAGGLSLELRGTDDAHSGLDDYAVVAGPASPGVDLSLGVTHAPYRRLLDAMCADGVPLVLAGHTHGGQVCLPWYGALVTNCDLPRAMASGLHRYRPEGSAGGEGTWLHVSAGLGTSPYTPFRLFCRPEVCLIDLQLA